MVVESLTKMTAGAYSPSSINIAENPYYRMASVLATVKNTSFQVGFSITKITLSTFKDCQHSAHQN